MNLTLLIGVGMTFIGGLALYWLAERQAKHDRQSGSRR